MKCIISTLFFILSFNALAKTLLLGTIESSISEYGDEPRQSYILKINDVLVGEYNWQYKKVVVHEIVSTQTLSNGRMVLVEMTESDDTIVDLFENHDAFLTESSGFIQAFTEKLQALLDEQNEKFLFAANGTCDFQITAGSVDASIKYDKIYTSPETAIITNYYVSNIAKQFVNYMKFGDKITFRLRFKDGKTSVSTLKSNGNFIELENALTKYDKKG